MNSGGRFLEQHRKRLSAASGEQFVDTHENFVRDLARRQDDPTDRLGSDEHAAFAAFFTQCQRRYLATKEQQESEVMMAGAKGAADSVIASVPKGFGRDAYRRVGDLIDMVPACRNVVMVGCGAFPATLLWLRDHFPSVRYTGLDTNARCVATATKLTEAMGLEMDFRVIDGSDYNFAGADFVYVANHVTPKKAVLEQVARSGNVMRVVVREPTRKGELLAEAVRFDLPQNISWSSAKASKARSFFPTTCFYGACDAIALPPCCLGAVSALAGPGSLVAIAARSASA
jgi:hypothetical protein